MWLRNAEVPVLLGKLWVVRSRGTKKAGTFKVKRNKRVRRVVVSADGQGVVSHAGVGLLREMAEYGGLVEGVTEALIGTYRGAPVHAPGRVFTDLAVAVADGADAISGISVLGDRQDLFGPVASMPTTWRVLDRVTEENLPTVRAARAQARAAAWAAGASPDLDAGLCLDFDATITIAHSEKENAAATWKKTFGFHPLLCFLDRRDVAGGEALAGLLRKGNAGSNTAADHIVVVDMALDALPEHARPTPGRGARLLDRATGLGPQRLRRRHPRLRPGMRGPRSRVLLFDSVGTHGFSGSSRSSPRLVGTPHCRPIVATGPTCATAPGSPRPPA